LDEERSLFVIPWRTFGVLRCDGRTKPNTPRPSGNPCHLSQQSAQRITSHFFMSFLPRTVSSNNSAFSNYRMGTPYYASFIQ